MLLLVYDNSNCTTQVPRQYSIVPCAIRSPFGASRQPIMNSHESQPVHTQKTASKKFYFYTVILECLDFVQRTYDYYVIMTSLRFVGHNFLHYKRSGHVQNPLFKKSLKIFFGFSSVFQTSKIWQFYVFQVYIFMFEPISFVFLKFDKYDWPTNLDSADGQISVVWISVTIYNVTYRHHVTVL